MEKHATHETADAMASELPGSVAEEDMHWMSQWDELQPKKVRKNKNKLGKTSKNQEKPRKSQEKLANTQKN